MNLGTARRGVREIATTEEGKKLFAERPRIDHAHVDFDALARLPDGTLGREYVRFLEDNGITPEAFVTMPDIGDEDATYIVMRYRQTHDLWHVLTGYAPNVEGEILLQAFTFGQTRAPSAALITSVGTVRHMLGRKKHLANVRKAYARGARTKSLGAFRWENHWEKPLAEVRRMLSYN